MPSTLLSVLLLAALYSSCVMIVGPVCTHEVRPGLMVEVRDSITGAPVAAGARVIARDGAFADTAFTGSSEGVAGADLAHERAGNYTVTVEQEEFAPWSRSDVYVTADKCHVHTVSLVVLLHP
jgi:hypothetical protein